MKHPLTDLILRALDEMFRSGANMRQMTYLDFPFQEMRFQEIRRPEPNPPDPSFDSFRTFNDSPLPSKKPAPMAPPKKPAPNERSVAPPLEIADIRRHGTKIVIPEGMSLEAARDVLERREQYDEAIAAFTEQFDAFPYDGAHALFQVMRDTFGFVENVTEWTFFGPIRPQMLTVRTGYATTVSVPWGKFALPEQLGGTIEPGAVKKDGRFIFTINAEVQRKNEGLIQELFKKVRNYLADHSIYRGKAIAVQFFNYSEEDENGELQPLPMPEPQFMDTDVDEGMLTFNKDTAAAIHTNLFVPITRLKDLVANGIPIKRGVLLGGVYGTGKTLTAKVASKFAQDAEITFIYVRRAEELAHAIQFAKPYSKPAVVVFCEDIDSVTDGDRDEDMNRILNTLDGVDTKSMDLITLLTTNHVDRITLAMLRPGRLDAVITIPPPDAEAVEKLLRLYGNGVIPKNADLKAVGEELAGAIPAVVAEVVKRAKLSQLALQAPGTKITEISAAALLEAAKTMRAQRELLQAAPVVEIPVE